METTLTMVSNSLTGGNLESLSTSFDKFTDAVDRLTDSCLTVRRSSRAG